MLHPLSGDGDRGDVGLRIHPCGSGQRPGVLGGTVGQGIPGLLGDTDQCLVGPDDRHLECIDGLLLLGGTDDEGIVLAGHSDELPQCIDVGLLDTVVGELVGVEDSLDSLGPGTLCHLGTEPEGLVVTVHDTGESGKTDGDDLSLVIECALDDLGLTVLEDLGHIDGLEDSRCGSPLVEDGLDPDQHLLPGDLVPDVIGDELQVSDSLELDTCSPGDGDVQVLTDGTDSPLDLPGGPEEGSDPVCDLHDLLGSPHVGSGSDLDEGDTQTVGPVEDLVALGLDLPACILLETDGEDGDLPVPDLDVSIGGDEGGPLESGGVGSIDDDLPHEVDLIDDVGMEHLGEGQSCLHGICVDIMRGLLVQLHEAACALAALVPVSEVPLELSQCGTVDLSHLGGCGPEPPVVGSLSLLAETAVT